MALENIINNDNENGKITTITNEKSSNLPSQNMLILQLPPCCQMKARAAVAAYNSKNDQQQKNLPLTKLDPRFGLSLLRQLLPIALCILSFATVLSILIVYMDTAEIRHQQFRLNMSRDYELIGVSQDDPTLIAFLREIHMKKYPMTFLKNIPTEHINFTEHNFTEMAHYIANLAGNKKSGAFIQSLTGATRSHLTGPWLAETLNWSGLIIEPEPRRYFTLRKQNAKRYKTQLVHACVSPNQHPREVSLHNEEDSDVRINSLLDGETSWFNSRVKCFPLYTLMLAVNCVNYDLLSLGLEGEELQILQTLPFDKININIITIHLPDNEEFVKIPFEHSQDSLDHHDTINYHEESVSDYIRSITKFLLTKSYKLQKKILNNYIFQKIQLNRNRKKFQSFSKQYTPTLRTL